MIDVIHIVLFTFLAVIAIAVIRLRDLFAAVMLMGIFSLLSASLFTVMDAVDVAFTEAAVGAGISTVLMLATLSLTTSKESTLYQRPQPMALIAVVLTGAALVYATTWRITTSRVRRVRSACPTWSPRSSPPTAATTPGARPR